MNEAKTSNENVYLPLLVLDFRFYIVDRIRRLNLKGDCLASKSLNKDLHAGCECVT